MIKTGEEVADVRVEHPVHPLALNADRERVQRMVRAAPWPEPVGEAQEIRLIDGVEHLHDGTLGDLVFQRGNAERPQPPERCIPCAATSRIVRWSGCANSNFFKRTSTQKSTAKSPLAISLAGLGAVRMPRPCGHWQLGP